MKDLLLLLCLPIILFVGYMVLLQLWGVVLFFTEYLPRLFGFKKGP